uniref:Transposase n=1 Tax=Parastrongyloides trichosuri TaxID=131310 RepID=A0A0N5A0M5_PARTI
MKIWRKQKERRLTEAQDAAAARIASKLIKMQKQAADYLNRKTA